MWVFLSRRLRTWLALAVAIPLLRAVLRALGARSARRNPTSATTTTLRKAENFLAGLSSRSRRRRQGR
ncbi:hypothetical protein M6D93_00210 [Jatrophihabitans telluris]|uniref:Uncharacterized protein n=1 Tax=Jatrophihabitans telluris TaxID=2038343 RepID=A0ABY4QXQ7_9ACTN|nr:hypothetical protein [Jatrophihabitans telluris]UQX88443.1 hypothetical protein M6D93_00210 [Jatrophihabitans telluris]